MATANNAACNIRLRDDAWHLFMIILPGSPAHWYQRRRLWTRAAATMVDARSAEVAEPRLEHREVRCAVPVVRGDADVIVERVGVWDELIRGALPHQDLFARVPDRIEVHVHRIDDV